MRPGETPPDSLGRTRQGNEVSLAAQRGKVVVISFWATWCGYCTKKMPVLANLQAIARDRHLLLQVISIDSRESRQIFVRSARALQPRLPGLLLSWDPDGKIGAPYGTGKGIPVMVMLHRDGTVAHVHVGYSAGMLDSLVAEINDLPAEPDLAPPTPGGKEQALPPESVGGGATLRCCALSCSLVRHGRPGSQFLLACRGPVSLHGLTA